MRVLQIAQGAAAVLLVWAVDRHGRDYYNVLRWVVCLVAVASAVSAARAKAPNWAGGLVTIALLFNPFVPIRLPKATWTPINLISAAALLVLIFRSALLGRRAHSERHGVSNREATHEPSAGDVASSHAHHVIASEGDDGIRQNRSTVGVQHLHAGPAEAVPARPRFPSPVAGGSHVIADAAIGRQDDLLTTFTVVLHLCGAVIALIAILSACLQLELLARAVTGDVSDSEAIANDAREQAIGVVQLVLAGGAFAAFLAWFHRARANLPALGAVGLKYSLGWAVGGYFVPFLNLVRPYQVMREVWRHSVPDTLTGSSPSSSLVGWWWAAAVAGTVVSVGARGAARAPSPSVEDLQATTIASIVLDAVLIVYALSVVRLVRRISKWHGERLAVVVGGHRGSGQVVESPAGYDVPIARATSPPAGRALRHAIGEVLLAGAAMWLVGAVVVAVSERGTSGVGPALVCATLTACGVALRRS